jgi:hypothetical protein
VEAFDPCASEHLPVPGGFQAHSLEFFSIGAQSETSSGKAAACKAARPE